MVVRLPRARPRGTAASIRLPLARVACVCARADVPRARMLGLVQLHQYQVIGRHLPTAAEANPPLFRMRLFAKNTVVAKSRFWYFLGQLHKLKRATGEIVAVNEVRARARARSAYLWLRRRCFAGA